MSLQVGAGRQCTWAAAVAGDALAAEPLARYGATTPTPRPVRRGDSNPATHQLAQPDYEAEETREPENPPDQKDRNGEQPYRTETDAPPEGFEPSAKSLEGSCSVH